MISMRTEKDCGLVAMANLLEKTGFGNADKLYYQIALDFDFPFSGGIIDDLWDSPSRHIEIVERISNKPVGSLSDQQICRFCGPCVVLLRLSSLVWHWVFVEGISGNRMVWHDGRNAGRTDRFQDAFPGCSIALVYAIGSENKLSAAWGLWYFFTKKVVAFSNIFW